MGWSTWNTFKAHISEDLIKQSADFMAQSTLKKAGYDYILIDDGWPACKKQNPDGRCIEPVGRDSQNRIQVNQQKFPSGMKSLVDYVHSKGLKFGIYTSVSPLTCAGYTGSFQFEIVDALTFAEWGIDFIKYDTCGTSCGVHDGCIQNATKRMRQGIEQSKKKIFFYIDHGNPTNPQKVYNPKNFFVKDLECTVKLATNPQELVWTWAMDYADMFKSWFDISDNWQSTLSNIHNQIRLAEWQTCGFYHTPDMLTVGMGGQSYEEYKAQFLMWAVLGSPLILGNDIRSMEQKYIDLVTHDEILAIAQDKDCVMGSLVNIANSTEIWIRPLSDNSFSVVTLNKDSVNKTVKITILADNNQDNYFFPAELQKVKVRDVYRRKELGVYDDHFYVEVASHSAEIFKLIPTSFSIDQLEQPLQV